MSERRESNPHRKIGIFASRAEVLRATFTLLSLFYNRLASYEGWLRSISLLTAN
ncbi:MAG: hypothetical protein JJT94_13665 [Bernardetiaceae bacterium]|nr:hypothetical protein [Bernardetiaceae bacterium]